MWRVLLSHRSVLPPQCGAPSRTNPPTNRLINPPAAGVITTRPMTAPTQAPVARILCPRRMSYTHAYENRQMGTSASLAGRQQTNLNSVCECHSGPTAHKPLSQLAMLCYAVQNPSPEHARQRHTHTHSRSLTIIMKVNMAVAAAALVVRKACPARALAAPALPALNCVAKQ